MAQKPLLTGILKHAASNASINGGFEAWSVRNFVAELMLTGPSLCRAGLHVGNRARQVCRKDELTSALDTGLHLQ